ncbi:protein-glutamine gamma-glutamyltransferase [Chengkuizengella axinellae]|uniref:Protein-glutamine gamma-glutamyltransferase n=1 Tax=Chengkuizengella axinellae TaxID=3064388 RepID=A0ABT9J4U4_9BACL|nr:protein-glutamine gamma-glutamyltransferase [Chengkuizengella sp. 2205SS18-9]MDP5276623.1 protein-glutamine gamma-glutamyltransferase [Chengkuizengella sp. 2205SS18-9]
MIEMYGRIVTLPQLESQMVLNEFERKVLYQMLNSEAIYYYSSPNQLKFELEMRQNIVQAAQLLNDSDASFSTFKYARSNPRYWYTERNGAFKLLPGVRPSDAINDIFANGSEYAFECATGMVIILYKAVLHSLGEKRFNYLFQDLYLWAWQYDKDLNLETTRRYDYFPGDILYFDNPDVDPSTPYWQGENAVYMGNGLYFGHGIGIETREGMIEVLNSFRYPGAMQSAFLLEQATRPNFKKLYEYTFMYTPQYM